jgi:hypothetical protein
LAIERSHSRPARPGRVVQPIDEVLHSGAIEIPHTDLAIEVRQRELTSSRRYSRRVLMRTLSCPVPA